MTESKHFSVASDVVRRTFLSYCVLRIYFRLLEKMSKARILILIIDAPAGTKKRWDNERRLWSSRVFPRNIKAYLVRGGTNGIVRRAGPEVGIFSGGGKDSFRPGIFNKTIAALESFRGQFDFVVRTNLSTFVRLNELEKACRKLMGKSAIYGGNSIKVTPNRNVRRLTYRAIGHVRKELQRPGGSRIFLDKVAAEALLAGDTLPQERREIPDDDLIGVVLFRSARISGRKIGLLGSVFVRCKNRVKRHSKLVDRHSHRL